MIGIVGNGFVGNAVYQNFRDKTQCKVYDVDKNRSLNTLSEVIEQDFIFVCLPTPMRYGGECDLSILDNFFESLPDPNFSPIIGTFIIKSTVPVGTTRKYYEQFNVIHNPEFLTARNAIKDFANSERNIVGGDMDLCVDFVSMFEKFFPEIPSIITTSDESEAIKYFSNTFLAYKVAYFNKIYDMCEVLGMDYDAVKEGIVADSRIGKSHTNVPGIDNDRGFGGTCFPKDINSLIKQMESHNIDAEMLKKVWEYNQSIRSVVDWIVT